MKEMTQAPPEVVIAFPKNPNELTWEDVRAMGLHCEPDDAEYELYDDENLMGGDNGELLIVQPAVDGTVLSTRPYGPKPTAAILPLLKP